jgi:hypothetical protein
VALLRKILAILSGLCGLCFAAGLVLMPPAHLGALLTLAVVAGLLLVAAPFIWPRRPRLALDTDARLTRL